MSDKTRSHLSSQTSPQFRSLLSKDQHFSVLSHTVVQRNCGELMPQDTTVSVFNCEELMPQDTTVSVFNCEELMPQDTTVSVFNCEELMSQDTTVSVFNCEELMSQDTTVSVLKMSKIALEHHSFCFETVTNCCSKALRFLSNLSLTVD